MAYYTSTPSNIGMGVDERQPAEEGPFMRAIRHHKEALRRDDRMGRG